MSIKTTFSIKDLENLSGIKAHTIRIWEKRYNLLEPMRTDTNIRTYNLNNLTKLLNVALLNQNGVKVSKIAQLNQEQINQRIREFVAQNPSNSKALNAFKLAMLNFDQPLFDSTFNQLLAERSFRDIFLNVMLQLLEDIGLLWSSNTITPAHEHFVSTLIKQKLLLNIERVQSADYSQSKTAILFLPLNEIHELGLLYIHFELLIKGYRSIYLGPSVPINNLVALQKVFPKIEFVSYFTVAPHTEHTTDYLNEIQKSILNSRKENLHILGRNTQHLNPQNFTDGIKIYPKITDLLNEF